MKSQEIEKNGSYNASFFMKENMENFVSRFETINGIDYTVFTATLLREKVVRPASSNREHISYLALADEFCKNVHQWNDIPIVLNHPDYSARVPDTLNQFAMGRIYNARRVNNDLVADIYLQNNLNLESNDDRKDLFQKLMNKENIELSIGFNSNIISTDGIKVYGNSIYTAIFKDIVADHLALLSQGRGACSNMDGCGIDKFIAFSEGELIEFCGESCDCDKCKLENHKNSNPDNIENVVKNTLTSLFSPFIEFLNKKDLTINQNVSKVSEITNLTEESIMTDEKIKTDDNVASATNDSKLSGNEEIMKFISEQIGLNANDIKDAITIGKRAKMNFIENIAKNERCPLSIEQLKEKNLSELEVYGKMLNVSFNFETNSQIGNDTQIGSDTQIGIDTTEPNSETKSLCDEKFEELAKKETDFSGRNSGKGNQNDIESYTLKQGEKDPLLSVFDNEIKH